jgi:hypothetical protein
MILSPLGENRMAFNTIERIGAEIGLSVKVILLKMTAPHHTRFQMDDIC